MNRRQSKKINNAMNNKENGDTNKSVAELIESGRRVYVPFVPNRRIGIDGNDDIESMRTISNQRNQ